MSPAARAPGRGDVDLVVVPALGGSRAMLRPFVGQLPDWVRWHVLEPPGFGDAPPPRGVPSTRRLARAAASRWPPHAPRTATYLFGISLGGMVAQWLALDAAAPLSGLVLASTAHRGLRALGSPTQALELARQLAAPGEEAHARVVEEVVERPSAAAGARRAAQAHPRDKADLVWLSAAAAAHAAPVERLRTPTVVLTGGDDPLVRPDWQRDLARQVRAVDHRVLEGVGHDLTLDAPAACAGAVVEALLAMGAR